MIIKNTTSTDIDLSKFSTALISYTSNGLEVHVGEINKLRGDYHEDVIFTNRNNQLNISGLLVKQKFLRYNMYSFTPHITQEHDKFKELEAGLESRFVQTKQVTKFNWKRLKKETKEIKFIDNYQNVVYKKEFWSPTTYESNNYTIIHHK